jgi:hypothetical protein
MKKLVFVFMVFSALVYGQQKRNLDWSTKDSVAVKNVNSILDYSKKSFSNLKSDVNSSSAMNKNLNQLLVNTINFNTVVNGQYVTSVEAGTFTKPRIDAVDRAGRMLMSIPVYKSK